MLLAQVKELRVRAQAEGQFLEFEQIEVHGYRCALATSLRAVLLGPHYEGSARAFAPVWRS